MIWILTALIVMAQTVYLKYFVWHDWVTSTSGIVLGCVAAIIAWQMEDACDAPSRRAFVCTHSQVPPPQ